jgi:hypothetical protein
VAPPPPRRFSSRGGTNAAVASRRRSDGHGNGATTRGGQQAAMSWAFVAKRWSSWSRPLHTLAHLKTRRRRADEPRSSSACLFALVHSAGGRDAKSKRTHKR